jgi:hypothetical protein
MLGRQTSTSTTNCGVDRRSRSTPRFDAHGATNLGVDLIRASTPHLCRVRARRDRNVDLGVPRLA